MNAPLTAYPWKAATPAVAPDTRLAYALRYAAIGWHVMPLWWANDDHSCACGNEHCGNVGKHPISELVPQGQNNASTDPAVLRYWFETVPQANIGVFLSRSKLVAIDIDPRNGGAETFEAIEARHGRLESDVLAYTGGGGEHRVFSLPEGGATLPGQLGPGVDVKLNGYIVVEPSNHKSGQSYQWEGSSDPLEGAIPSPLPDWLRDLAHRRSAEPVQCVGDRYAPPEQIAELRDALEYIAADEYHQWINIGQALRSIGSAGFELWDTWSQKSAKYQAQAQGKKWRSFRPGAYNIESIFKLAQDAGWLNPLSATNAVAAAQAAAPVMLEPSEEVAAPTNVIPADLLNPPGILGEITRHILATAQRPQPVLAVTAALALAGTVLGQKVATETGLRTNLYLVGVAGTAAGKEHVRQSVKNALVAARLDDFIGGEDVGSGAGLLSRVAQTSNVIFQIDEFGLFMQEVQNPKAGSHKASILTNLIKLFSSAGTVFHGTEYANQKERPRQDIAYPCVTLHATTTPETLFDALGSAHVTSGYLNRMLVTFAADERPARQRVRHVPPPAPLVAWIESARAMQQGLAGLNPEAPIVVEMDAAANALFDQFDDEIEARLVAGEKTGTAPLWGRAWEHAAKVALVCACALDTVTPVIDARAAEWAIRFARFHLERIDEEVRSRMADSPFAKIVLDVVRLIERAGSRGLTERDLTKLSRPFKGMKPQERDQVLATILRDGDAGWVTFQTQSGRGRPRHALVAAELLELLDQSGDSVSPPEIQQ